MSQQPPHKPLLLNVNKIWDYAPHCGMTDLIRFKSSWYCVFRESDRHVKGKNGIIRILISSNGICWTSVYSFAKDAVDLRDPKLSIMPDGRLMLLVGGSVYSAGHYSSMQTYVAFSHDGVGWSILYPILQPHEWLWRVTWYQGIGYGTSYSFSNPQNKHQEWVLKLFSTTDGLNYEEVSTFDIKGFPNETTLRFFKNGEMCALVRRDDPFGEKKSDGNAWVGKSLYPYQEWMWLPLQFHLGGPNFIISPDEEMWAAGRILRLTPYGLIEKTTLGTILNGKLIATLTLPSGGDTSYPGMVLHEGVLWLSYYSSHEKNSAIYLAQIQFFD